MRFQFMVKLLLLVTFSFSCSQKRNPSSKYFTIDPSLISETERKIRPFDGRANAVIYFVVFEGDREVLRDDGQGEAALSFTTLEENTAIINCLNGTDEGFGFALFISKDTSFVKFNVASNDIDMQFKTSVNDFPQPQLMLNCTYNKVQLANQPVFQAAEVIHGKVELESEPFYEIDHGKERKVKFKITCYFKSEPLPVINNKYKTLKHS